MGAEELLIIIFAIIFSSVAGTIILYFTLKERNRQELKIKFYREAIANYNAEYQKVLFHFYNVAIAFGEQVERISYQSEECIKEHKLQQYLLELWDLLKGSKEILIHLTHEEQIRDTANYIVKEATGILELNENMLRHLKNGYLEEQRIDPDSLNIKFYKSNNERIQKELKLWVLDYTEHCVKYHTLMLENYNNSFKNEKTDERN